MMQNTQQPPQQEWQGDRGSAATPVKADEPTYSNAAPPADEPMPQLEYMPTPFNPPRIDRCRVDNFLMLFMMALMFVFGVAALATPLVMYRSSAISITVDCLYVWGASSAGTHTKSSNHDIFCDSFTTKSDGFAALFIICVLFSVLGFVLALVPIICGRVLCCRFFVQVLILLCWFFTMVGMILAAQMRNEKLCQSTALKDIGFSYGPAFGLAVTLFVFFTITLVVIVVWMIKWPAKLRY